MKAIFSDDSVIDSHSERVMVDGIDLKRFKKNPVLLLNHNNYSLPVGKVVLIAKEGSQLKGEIEFFTNETSQKIKAMYKGGFMNAFSIGFSSIEKSEDEKYLLPGQKKATITKSELYEISAVVLPSNPECLVERSVADLEFKDFEFKKVEEETNVEQTKISIKMNLVTKRLGLGEGASESEVVLKVEELYNTIAKKDADIANIQAALAQIETDKKAERSITLVQKAVEAGKIVKSQEAFYLKMADVDFEETKKHLDAMDSYNPLFKSLASNKSGYGEKEDWTFTDWQKKDSKGLEEMREKDPERFKELINKIKR